MSLHVKNGLGAGEGLSGGRAWGPGQQVRGPPITYLASRAKAIMPAASGAEADVPVCLSVHWWCRSVVTWGQRRGLGTGHVKTQPSFAEQQGLEKAPRAAAMGPEPGRCPGHAPQTRPSRGEGATAGPGLGPVPVFRLLRG